MHERLARIMAKEFSLAYAPLPFKFPVMREMLQYHRARAPDEGLAWLRQEIVAVVAEIDISDANGKASKQ